MPVRRQQPTTTTRNKGGHTLDDTPSVSQFPRRQSSTATRMSHFSNSSSSSRSSRWSHNQQPLTTTTATTTQDDVVGRNHRRTMTIQIRKQRHDNLLRRKRGITTVTDTPLSPPLTRQETTTTTTTTTMLDTDDNAMDDDIHSQQQQQQHQQQQLLRTIVEKFCRRITPMSHFEDPTTTVTTNYSNSNDNTDNNINKQHLMVALYSALMTTVNNTTECRSRSRRSNSNRHPVTAVQQLQQQQQQHSMLEYLLFRTTSTDIDDGSSSSSSSSNNKLVLGYHLIHQLMMQLMECYRRHSTIAATSTTPTAQYQYLKYMEMIATILVELTSIPLENHTNNNGSSSSNTNHNNSNTITPNNTMMNHPSNDDIDDEYYNYYGGSTMGGNTTTTTTPTNWYELWDVTKMDPNSKNSNDSSHPQSQQHPLPNYHPYLQLLFQIIQDDTTNSTTTTTVVELLCHLIGNLVLQQPQQPFNYNNSYCIFLETLVTESNWSILVSKLPDSTFCCACIVRMDQRHSTMDFVRPLLLLPSTNQPPLQMTATTMNQTTDTTIIRDTFAPLLSRSTEMICVETAWILEGFTRREVEGIYTVFSISNHDPTDVSLLRRLMEQIAHHTQVVVTGGIRRNETLVAMDATAATTNSMDVSTAFLVPALRTICNIAFGLECLDYRMFLTVSIHLIEPIQRLIVEHSIVVIDAIYVAHAILMMSTRIWNSETTTITCTDPSHLTLSQVQGCVSDLILPLVYILTMTSSRFEWKRESILCLVDILLDHCTDASTRRLIVQECIWKKLMVSDVRDHPTVLIQSIVDMMQLSDIDIVTAAMKLLNILLRTIDDSRVIFMNTRNGIDVLNDICTTTDHTYDENTQDLAVQLVEDYFDNENDDHDNGDAHGGMMSIDSTRATLQNQYSTFTFGIQHVSTTGSYEFSQPQLPANGRGRGRVIPAWMSQQQQ